MIRRASSSQHGQATVELVALVPLLVVVAFAVIAVLSAGRAASAAESAAEAGAVAILRGADGAAAARRSLAARRNRATVTVRGGRVRVTVRPSLPLLAGALTATAQADAGRVTPVIDALSSVRGGDGTSSAPGGEDRGARKRFDDVESGRRQATTAGEERP